METTVRCFLILLLVFAIGEAFLLSHLLPRVLLAGARAMGTKRSFFVLLSLLPLLPKSRSRKSV